MRLLALVLAIVGISACGSVTNKPDHGLSPELVQLAAERLSLETCLIEGVDELLLCGVYFAPLKRSDPDSGFIPISVIVIPAITGNPKNLAITEHQGGPGRAMLSSAYFYMNTEIGKEFRRDRDIVLFDQRGTGESGNLYCHAMREVPILEPYYTERKVSDCRDELISNRIDLSAYSTIEAIDDLEDIRQWLGYEKFDVAGWSYGSRFMLTYAHRYPESLRSIIVAVPTLFDYRRPIDWARFSQDSIEGLFQDCEADEECANAYPYLSAEFDSVLSNLDAGPESVKYRRPGSDEIVETEVTRDRFMEELHVGLLKVSNTRQLPLVIHSAAKGDFEPFLDLAVPERPSRPVSEGQYLSIVCPEETVFFNQEEAIETSRDTFAGMYFVDEFKMACETWGLPPHPDYPLVWVGSEIPALVISGGRDPITPTEYGERIAASFDHARHVDVEIMPHDTSGLEGSGCLDDLMLEFIRNPSPADLDTTCVDDMKAPPFMLPDD
ncbi:MAG TPA: alpha/beta fold hydrolase [Xanthomonadales bacterium]|nr:alpha/beta fold hydrolase [Xanthomonadales bacterium]